MATAPTTPPPNTHATISTEAALDTTLSNAEKVLLLILACFVNAEGRCRIHQRTLAEGYGCSLRFVRILLVGLRAKGYIVWERGAALNQYRILR